MNPSSLLKCQANNFAWIMCWWLYDRLV